MKLKYFFIILFLFFLTFIAFPSFESFITGMTPGSGCCHYHLTFNMNYDTFREKYSKMFKGRVNARAGDIIFVKGYYFRVTSGRPFEDSTKSYISFGEFCYDTSDIHNNQNYFSLHGIYYWRRKYLLWKIKSFFAEDMVKFEYETLFE